MARGAEKQDRKKTGGFGAWLRNNFFAGIVVVTPIAVTALLMITLVTFVDSRVENIVGWVDPYLPGVDLSGAAEGIVPGLGVVLAFIAITFLGVLTRNIVGRFFIGLGERVLERVPLVSSIYGPIKQILETIFRDQGESFKEMALVEYPKEGTWALCFVTATAKGEIDEALRSVHDEEHVAVFIPTTPNPTSGFLLYVPRSKLRSLESMSVENGARAIISFGIVTSKDENGNGNGGKAKLIKPAEDPQPKADPEAVIDAVTGEMLPPADQDEDASSSSGEQADGPGSIKEVKQDP